MSERAPVTILIVLDGFGCRRDNNWNAVRQAKAPTFAALFDKGVWTTLEASGLRVGLPEGQMGNSEVGHLNMGAGRVVDQEIVRISKAVDQDELASNPTLVSAVERAGQSGRSIHLIGLLSDGGVHSLQHHLHGLIDAIEAIGRRGTHPPAIYIHAILDGRDTPPVSAKAFLSNLLGHIDGRQSQLATVIGRYYAMDRDRRWDRIQRSYDLMTRRTGTESADPLATLDDFYAAGITDEFMEPIAVRLPPGSRGGAISSGDTVMFFNFRADRMRQIVTSLTSSAHCDMQRDPIEGLEIITMVQYHEDYPFPVLFPPTSVTKHFGEVIAIEGLRQLRIAETEKFAHVTFFFNGGSDSESPGETRILIPSPKVATYDKQPEMSLPLLAARVVEEIESGNHDVIVLNIANPDMVGHTGVMEAAVAAVEATDRSIRLILSAVRSAGGVALITADHGNCELMYDEATGQPHTAHTTNPVPLFLVEPTGHYSLRSGGALENVAPTLLELLSIRQPDEMTARSLLVAGPSAASSTSS